MSDLPDFAVDRRGGTDDWRQAPAMPVDRGPRAVNRQPGRLGREPVPAGTAGSESR